MDDREQIRKDLMIGLDDLRLFSVIRLKNYRTRISK
jgi:hypothetical protein